jgi:uncharacterized integral membrane protein
MRVRLIIYLLVVILLSINAHAFGLSYQYLENNTLKLYPGQTYTFQLTVPNNEEEEANVNISIDSAIATVVGSPELKVPAKTYDKYFLFNITVPENAQPGDVYNINYLVSPVGRGEGQVPIVVRYDRNFKVLVVEKPKEAGEEQPAPIPEKPSILKWVFIPIILIVIIILVILLWNKSHQLSGRIMKKEHELKEIKPVRTALTEPKLITPEPQEPIEQPAPKPVQLKQEKTISPHHYFHLKSGRDLKNLGELYSALRNMSDAEFSHHVNPARNDFANWVAHVLGEEELAGKLRAKATKEAILELIKNELDQR